MTKRLSAVALVLTLLILASPYALAAGATPAQEQQRALNEVNRYRRAVGLPSIASSSALNSAARRHSCYMVRTGEYGHYENNSKDVCYSGYKPEDRARRYGYANSSVTEDMLYTSLGAAGTRTYLQADNAVQWWMGAIYHRFAIVSPRTEHIGYGPYYGAGSAASVMDFGSDYGLTGPLTRWPVPGQRGVGASLENEHPNPVEQFHASCPCGYPVSMTWYRGAVKYTSITMVRTKDGASISGYRLSPQNDDFHRWSTSLSFIPKQPLSYGTQYRVTFKGVFSASGNLSSGTSFSSSWWFITAPAPGKLVSSAPGNGASRVSRSPNLSLSFNQSVRSYTLVRSPYRGGLDSNGIGLSLTRMSDGADVSISITRPAYSTTKAVSLRPSVALAPNTRYRLAFRLADAWGRPQGGTVYFTTGS